MLLKAHEVHAMPQLICRHASAETSDNDFFSRMVGGSSGETTKSFQPQQQLPSMWRMFRTLLLCSSGLPTMDMFMRTLSQ